MDYIDLSSLRQEHMAGLFSRAREMRFARPELRLWSLTCGSVKYSRGDTGHGGGLNWTISSCELLHLQFVELRIVTICDYHTRCCYFYRVKCNRYISERMRKHDGISVSEITRGFRSVLVKLHPRPSHFAAAVIHLSLL